MPIQVNEAFYSIKKSRVINIDNCTFSLLTVFHNVIQPVCCPLTIMCNVISVTKRHDLITRYKCIKAVSNTMEVGVCVCVCVLVLVCVCVCVCERERERGRARE